MAAHNSTGTNGEKLALAFLQDNGFVILHNNWRHSYYEIDIIAVKEELLHFVEVKTRRSLKFGFPEESVSEKKMENLMNAADAFLLQNPQWKRVQFDILSVQLLPGKAPEYYFIEDVYL